ncbi:glycosyltransferase family A protein [Streptococcus sp. WB01_FAA12]|uniref:glycosyltransferase family 2 protein n=1 Tax=Streptococcus sp. WB01_FAA12 TaxID=2725308 RepID=UPI00146F62B9|nr:glycosyltransferase family A protein [Streptococcus sp. WB01_FAA12]NMD84671.1 glycosyltransferase family 2 protein [Streptococcus sp. WB01_FAA12]
MTYQLIVSTMNQHDDSLIEKMNIKSNAIIINQSNSFSYHETILGNSTIKWYEFNERGIGLSRNTGLMRSDADIIQFADDDMVFTDTYYKDVLLEYQKHPEADVILFSNKCLNEDRMPYQVDNFGRINRLEGVKFGGARITARREKLLYNNITFSLLFGGGARYGAGEDVTFIQDCLKAGLRVYKSPIIVSTMKQDSSTWFKGYDRKYYKDKGALLAANFPFISTAGSYIQAFKNKGAEHTFLELLGYYKEGIDEFKGSK